MNAMGAEGALQIQFKLVNSGPKPRKSNQPKLGGYPTNIN